MKCSEITSSQSKALRIATFLSTLLVILRHSFNLHLYYAGGNPWMSVTDANIYIQRVMVNVTNVAIPSFFFMSGFLYFRNIREWQDCVRKWKSRVSTLLVPYLLWNLLLLGLVLALSSVPSLRPQLERTYRLDYSWQWTASKMTLHPIMGHFWYIRTLLLFMLATPLLYFVLQNHALSFILLFILARCWKPIDTGILSTEGALYFYCGCWMATHGGLPEARPFRHWFWLLLIWGYNYFVPIIFPQCVSVPGGIALSMYAGWQICLLLAERPRVSSVIVSLNKYSFFIYAMHATFLSGSALYLSRCLPHTSAYSFGAYLGCFLIISLLCLAISMAVKKAIPKIYAILSGGR